MGLRLKVVGDGPLRAELENLTQSLGSNVTFTGEIEESNIPRQIASSEVYALLSSYEGQSFSLLQAMASGATILVSDTPGNVNVIRNDWSGIVVGISVAEITEGLRRLFSDSKLRRVLSENAKFEARNKYSLQESLEKTKKVIFME